MFKLGEFNNLEVIKIVHFGYYVGFSEEDKILLPTKEALGEKYRVGDKVRVFIYEDSEDRLVCTRKAPMLNAGEYAYLKVVDRAKFGYFAYWGLDKDLLIPNRNTSNDLEVGKKYVIKLIVDKQGRLSGTLKFRNQLKKLAEGLEEGQEVDILVLRESDLGYSSIVNNEFEGLLFKQDCPVPLKEGDKIKGFIKRIRDDKKIDLTMFKSPEAVVEEQAKIVMKKLRSRRGFLQYNYKSSPKEIEDMFGLSRKSFKRVLTKLSEDGIIEIKDDGIYKIDKNR